MRSSCLFLRRSNWQQCCARLVYLSSIGVAMAGVILGPALVKAQTAPTTPPPARPSTTDEASPNQGAESSEKAAGDFNLTDNLASFDQVWSTIDTTHWDEDIVGQTWDDAKAKYRPQVEAAKSIDEVRAILGSMIDDMGLSHFGIIPASSYDVVGEMGGSDEADAGLTFRATDGGVVVTEVRPDSPASRADVKPGWLVETIGGKSVAELSDKIRSAAHGPMRFETLAGLVLAKIAGGTVGGKTKFVFRDGDDQTKELDLELEASPGQSVQFGHLPPIRVHTTSETLPGNIGYYRFNAFLDPVRVMAEFRESVHDTNHHGGMVIDLRGNIGGLAGMTMGMASEFSDQQTSLGLMTMKGAELKFFVNANLDPVRGPVAVLIDECSISSAEIFSGGLQDLKLARLFGARSAGLALPSIVVKLPNGDGFQYAIANYHSASGKSLEMDGVTPDEIIPLSRELLLHDPDPVLTRALEWIKHQPNKK